MKTLVDRVARAAAVDQGPPPPRAGRRRVAWIALAILAPFFSLAAVASPAAGHPHPEHPHKPPPDQEVVVVAKKLANGQVEFGLRQRDVVAPLPPSNEVDIVISAQRLADGELEVETVEGEIDFDVVDRSTPAVSPEPWGEVQLPARRFFDPPALQFVAPSETPGQWLVSSSLKLTATAADQRVVDVATVRITARRLVNGNIEIGLQQQYANGSWGTRQLPSLRVFSYSSDIGQWRATSSIQITTK